MPEFTSIAFDLPKNQSNVIKVIGVGGGGSNAINHMFKQGIKGVDFVVCNTDAQALQNSPVPNKIQLGVTLTEGLGAGANPEVGHQSALENIAEIEKMLDTNTKMVFITAGMGGGTGTGAAPVIAQLAKERDILTVGIVTIPFQFEGKNRSKQALQGVEKLRDQVDSLIVVNNNKLREVYGNLGYKSGYSKADEVLATAARGIAEVISQHYIQNIDLRDAKTVLADSGTAIMGSATASGSDRAKEAIVNALDSPLLNDNKITGAKNVLLLIISGIAPEDEVTIDEIGEINEYIQNEAGYSANIIMGIGEDEKLGNSISVTVIATGFDIDQQAEIVNTEPKKIIHALEAEQKVVHDLTDKSTTDDVVSTIEKTPVTELPKTETTATSLSENYNNSNPDTFEIVTPETVELADATPNFTVDNTFNYPIDLFEEPSVKNEEVNEVNEEYTVENITNKSEDKEQIEITTTNNNIVAEEREAVIKENTDSEEKIIRHHLADAVTPEVSFVEKETATTEATIQKKAITDKEIAQEEDESLQFKITNKDTTSLEKNTTTINSSAEAKTTGSPFDSAISEVLKKRAEERKRKMKEFNYKFRNATSHIDEIEKEPAYKRMGIDVETTPNTENKSRVSLGTTTNNEVQLRSNNSFLHDNVD